MSKGRTIVEESARFRPGSSVGFWSGLAESYRSLSGARTRQFYTLLALMVIGAIAEFTTIGAILPFLSLLSDPAALGRFPVIDRIFSWLAPEGGPDRLFAATAIFAFLVIVSGAVRFELARLMQHFAFRVNHDLMLKIERQFLFQPYSFHIEQNTSTLIASVEKVELFVFDALLPLMQALTAGLIGLFIIAALVAIDPVTAVIAAAAFAAMYILVSLRVKDRLAANSAAVARGVDARLRILNESLGGIRDVIVDGSQSLYLDMFERENAKLNRARANTTVIASAPRFIIETIGILAMTAIAVWQSQRQGGFAAALPLLGAIALSAQRLLPLIQQLYGSWSSAAGHLSLVGEVGALLTLPMPSRPEERTIKPLPLKKRIEIDKVSFAYRSRKSAALEDMTFEIPAGSVVALIGPTGSGKSTVADLLMGLIDPDSGAIRVDGVRLSGDRRLRWQRSIAHVPQSIFLADTSIAQNIALSCPNAPIDMKRVAKAAETAQLAEFVESLPDGYHSFVGERGIRLSGGQRQRLGIARAVYKRPRVLVLDEATSALDEATETAVMDALLSLEGSPTVVIIAHRLSTVARSDRVIRLHQGRIVEIGTCAEVIGGAINRGANSASELR